MRQSKQTMKRLGLLFILISALAASAFAQDDDVKVPQQPDYSRNKLIQILADNPDQPRPQKPVNLGFGYIDFRALNMRWHIGYLPFSAPLYGSVPWAMNGAFGGMPDPFIATNTEIPQTPRTWAQNRALSSELKRIERTERAKEKEKPNATVTAKPQ